ncbi:MAG: YlxM family DNA-binding protein [Firmicutes bacterium]|nr:YlxM family DNA-binding protein [Bacillota bacterium]
MVRVGLLYDHYGPLLTARQREAVELYFFQDWSLQEIAESWETSRQAVHDLLGRAVRLLEGYEHRLGLAARGERRRTALADCAAKLGAARAALDRDAVRAGELLAEAAAAVEALLEAEGDGG